MKKALVLATLVGAFSATAVFANEPVAPAKEKSAVMKEESGKAMEAAPTAKPETPAKKKKHGKK